jgi:PAS domain S-box-containing protein/putative nucleotidyltransferase with HDIG domain
MTFKMRRKREEEIYGTLVRNSADGIYVVSRGGFEYVNPAFERLVGYSAGEICGPGFDLLALVHPDDRKLVREGIETRDGIFEFRIVSRDGGTKYVEAGTSALSKNGGRVMGILRETTARRRTEEELRLTLEKLQKAMGATIQAMSLTVETRDPYTAGHQRRVSDLAQAIATEMKLNKEEIDAIRMAASIHDLGKISIPAEILSKPGKINEFEFRLIQNHPQIGYEILRTIEFPWPIAEIVLQHHERINGSGYPNGLRGEEIHIIARILAVADVVEAMVSHRPYRSALTLGEAIHEITKNRGTLYDPDAVDACKLLFIEGRFAFKP